VAPPGLRAAAMDDPSTEPLGPYGRLAVLAVRHRLVVAAVLLVLTAVAGVVGLPPQVDNDLLSMMPQDAPVVEASTELAQEGGVDVLTLGFVVDDGAEASAGTAGASGAEGALDPEAERLQAYVEELGQALEALPQVDFVHHRVEPDLAYRLGLLQLDPDDLARLTERLRGAVAMGQALNPVILQRLLQMRETTERLARARDSDLLGGSGRTVRLLVRPTGTAQDRAFARAFYDQVQQVLRDHPPEEHGARLVWLGGAYRHVVEDIRTLQRDFGWTSGLAAVAVLFILTLAFRDLRAVVIVFVPIVVANIWTLGLIALTVGHLDSFTAAGVPVLIGLGIDFAVHLFGRYRELRTQGLPLELALARAWDRTGPPSVTAGLTSAAGFLALMAASFLGFVHFGLMLAFGLLACLAVMLVGLPVLVSWLDPAPRRALPGANPPDTPSSSTYRLAPVGLMVAVIATGVAGAAVLPDLTFDYDVSSLRAEGQAYDELSPLERELAEQSYSPLVLRFSDEAARNRAQERLDQAVERGDLPFASGTVSSENVLPSDQDRRVALLRELAEVVRDPGLRHVHASPARPMVEALMPLRDLDPEPLTADDLPRGLLEVMGAGDAAQLVVLPDGNIWDFRNALALTASVQELVPEARVAGSPALQGLLYDTVQGDISIVGALALLLVALLTAIDLRKPLFTVGAVGTLLAGLVWAGVMLATFRIPLTIVNLVGVPILLGIGVDVVIHLHHRLREEGPGGVRRAWRTTGVSALVSTTTTVASFGALTLADARGISALGLLVVIGLTTIAAVGSLLLPLAWAAGWRISGRAPGDDRESADQDAA
jgi:uncharacterized protein